MITIKRNKRAREISTGFSWKSLFFGIFYPFFRGDLTGFIIQLILAVITFGVSWFIIPFTYNDIFLRRMTRKGWYVVK